MKLAIWADVFATLAFTACISADLPTVAEQDVERARALFPDTSRERLQAGRSSYTLRCGHCHEPYQPALRTPGEWVQAVAIMSERAGLDGEKQELVLQYLSVFARR